MKSKGGKQKSNGKKIGIVVVIIILLAVIGAGVWWFLLRNQEENSENVNSNKPKEPIYSNMTGLEIKNTKENSAPTFCIQIPNGSTDGARPQVGLDQAAVVFEAIAETGITRFAAIFQDFSQTAMIGPIRSLRPYYLDWDTPFDCTVVHDGGSDEALAAVGNGKYRNLDENFDYMWKETYLNSQYRYWNNVFTSPEKLLAFNNSKSYSTSNPKTFPRLRPNEVSEALAQNSCEADAAKCLPPSNLATQIRTAFTNIADYIVNYQYDATTNTYLRFYEGTGAHETYSCPANLANPPEGCTLQQVAPSAVVAMHVQESTMSDGYHEQIKTVSEGKAEIFQNGTITKGTWKKLSQDSQIQFLDEIGNEIKFTPGQLWIATVPQFGSVSWE